MSTNWQETFGQDEQHDEDAWYTTDEFDDVAVSLKTLLFALRQAKNDKSFWKLAILSTHSALQGACVCLLTRTDGGGALAKRDQKALMHKLYGESEKGRNIDDNSVDWAEEFIASLPELLKRLPNDLAIKIPDRSVTSYPYDLPGDMRRLHEFRNKLTHFPPISWTLEISGLPRILLRAIEHIEKITISSAYKRYNRFLEIDLSQDFTRIREQFGSLSGTY